MPGRTVSGDGQNCPDSLPGYEQYHSTATPNGNNITPRNPNELPLRASCQPAPCPFGVAAPSDCISAMLTRRQTTAGQRVPTPSSMGRNGSLHVRRSVGLEECIKHDGRFATMRPTADSLPQQNGGTTRRHPIFMWCVKASPRAACSVVVLSCIVGPHDRQAGMISQYSDSVESTGLSRV